MRSFYRSVARQRRRQECQPPSRHDLSSGTSLAFSGAQQCQQHRRKTQRRRTTQSTGGRASGPTPGGPWAMGSKVVSLDSDERFQRHVNRQMAEVSDQNERLVNALREAREQIVALKEEVDKLCAPPSTYGVYLAANEDNTVTILSQGRKVKVNMNPP